MEVVTNRNSRRGKLLLFLIALSVLAGFQLGFSESQDIEQLRQAAEAGDPTAQFRLGRLYFAGEWDGLKAPGGKNYGQAVKWFTLAAKKEEGEAYLFLGWIYEAGLGVPQNYALAAKWFGRSAAEFSKGGSMGGTLGGAAGLARLYENGFGVPQDYALAVKWYTRAAELGDLLAQYKLAQMHLLGRGTPQGFVKAHAWFNLAAVQVRQLPEVIIDIIAAEATDAPEQCDRLADQMTPHQIAQAQRLAAEIHEHIKRIESSKSK